MGQGDYRKTRKTEYMDYRQTKDSHKVIPGAYSLLRTVQDQTITIKGLQCPKRTIVDQILNTAVDCDKEY